MTEPGDFKLVELTSQKERSARESFLDLFQNRPMPDHELMRHLHLFVKRQEWGRIFFLHELYRKILDIHGIVIEFGVRWGANLALFESLRAIYEPYNYTRRVVGFDTFAGFLAPHEKDGTSHVIEQGAYAVTPDYDVFLDRVLAGHEQEAPVPHIKKYELRKGDAAVQIQRYLAENPQTVIALAYFDFDLYQPTKECLEAILPYVTKGTILGFDELNFPDFPGETTALQEVVGLGRYSIRRLSCTAKESYLVIE